MHKKLENNHTGMSPRMKGAGLASVQNYLDIADVMIVEIDALGRVLLINQKGCRILGYKREDVVGKNWFDHFLPARLREEVAGYSRKLLQGKIRPGGYFENPVLTKSGKERILKWHNTILKDSAGKIIGHLSSGQDITEWKDAQAALRKSEARFKRVADSNMIALAFWDAHGRVLEANNAFLNLIGYSRRELKERKIRWRDLTPAEFIPLDDKALKQMQETGVCAPYEKESAKTGSVSRS